MKFSLVILAYNEGVSIGNVVRSVTPVIRKMEPSFELVVVNNGSTDNTVEVLENLRKEVPELKAVKVFPNQGYGNGVLVGWENSSGEVLGFMHADGQADLDSIPALYGKLISENLDFCKTVRIERKEPPFRIIQSVIYNNLFRLLFGGRYRDINGTPKIFRRSFYEKLKLSSRDWFLDPEIMLKAMRMKTKIGEVEISWDSRKGGPSHVSLLTALEFIKNMFVYKFFRRL